METRRIRWIYAGLAGLTTLGLGLGSLAQAQDGGREVVINGRALTGTQIEEMGWRYGARPQPGHYWYDARSGLYGVAGYQAYGFMYPGHEYGALSRDASRGDSGVIVNGRELPLAECVVWARILGTPIVQGSFWLDAYGNTGVEGNPWPLANLYEVARARAMAAGGGGDGDNFWSTRFSAGNSDQGGTRGYVSVPGYGPVGYGFD